jgi:Zn-dependent protease with chaperone function
VDVERFLAELMDGQSAAVRAVLVGVGPEGLLISDAVSDEPLGAWPLQGLHIEALGVLQQQHPHLPGALLTSRDPGLEAALRQAGAVVARLPRGRRLLRLAAIYGAALAVVVTALYAAVAPVSRLIARRVPLDVEERLGAQLDTFFEKHYCRTGEGLTALDQLTARLKSAPRGGPEAQQVEVLNWEVVNAFTFPGGKVIVTRGLLDKAESPDELAGVLAHELEHVRQRHIMAHVIRSSILGLGWTVTVGDFSGLFVLDPSTLFTIANQRFSRDDEASADAGAVARLDAGAISRDGFGAFFKRVQEETDAVPAWLSSHPATKDRLAAIAKGAPTAGARPALTPDAWKTLKQICGHKPKRSGSIRSLLRGD